MQSKLIMTWNVSTGSESDYSEFIVNDFIPRIQRLGLGDIQFWYTSYGTCEQILASGTTKSEEQMRSIILSEEWVQLNQRLEDLVTDFNYKIVPAKGGFQI
ncbi:MAG: hypothetical protein M9918_26230 [Anaerolineae bacterium]|nr:hypothetical protein [Anaerolineae bacterium]MCO5193220.1 hypothetical protein [Anaerolineae bacterium]